MALATPDLDFIVAQAGIRASVEGQMTVAFTNLLSSGADPKVIRESLVTLTRQMVAEYGEAAAGFAADWYNDMRATNGVLGRFTAASYTQDFTEPIDRTVHRAIGGLYEPNPNVAAIANAIAIKASQYAIDGARNTVVQNSYRDPQAAGWQRIPHGPTCNWCLVLVGRGGVYKRSTANFRAHGHCDCSAAPSWDLNAEEVPSIAYQGSDRMNALRNRAKAVGADGKPTPDAKSAERQLTAYRDRMNDYIANSQKELMGLRQQYNLGPEPAPGA